MTSRLAQQTGITTVSDAQLLAAYRDRDDASAYSELVRRHQIPVYRLLTGLLADPDLAEPVCEDVFVRAARRLEELADLEGIEPWLMGLAHELADERAGQPELELPRHPPDATLSADQGRDAMRGAVREVLSGLPPELRSVLVLSELHGEPVDRIARALGDSPRRIRERLAAAREAFVAALTARKAAAVGSPQPGVSADVPAEPDTIAEGYRIVSLLGSGGMGDVFLADDLVGKRRVALKVLSADRARVPGLRRRFEREALAMRAVRGPHLVEPYATGKTHDGGLFLAMEPLEGRELFDELDGGALPMTRAIPIARQVLSALACLHARDIVHRDIKPENVYLVQRSGTPDFVKLLDLGIAKLPRTLVPDEPQMRLTAAGIALGTPAYIAPEQALGMAIDGRADLYGVAVLLFEMLSGRLPFASGDAGAMLAMHVSAPAPRLARAAPRVPGVDRLDALVFAGMAKDPDDRPPTAEAFIAALDHLAAPR